jgi:hypothetical protein
MAERDEWGSDPQVRYLRRAFALMEKAQADLLHRLNVAPDDYRLRRIREAALRLFEQGGALAVRGGVVAGEEDTSVLYIYCLARILTANRIPVAEEMLPAHEKIARFMKEVMK